MVDKLHWQKHTITCGRLKLRVHASGIGDIPCVFIHGLADCAFVWENIACEIAPYFRSYAIDLRGHGDSDWDEGKNYSLDTYVADVETILDRLQLEKYVLIGHSLGGSIATRLIDKRPNEVLGAVLVDTSPTTNEDVQKYLREQLFESYVIYDSVEEYSEWLHQTRPLVSPIVAQQLARNCLRAISEGKFRLKFDVDVAKTLLDAVEDRWLWSRLGTFNQPILLVRGSGSAILSRRTADIMLEMLPQGKFATVDLAGHSVMTDNPGGFCSAVTPFLKMFLRFH